MSLSSRERVLLALDHQQTDRVPIATVCAGVNRPALDQLVDHLGLANAAEGLAWIDAFVDIKSVAAAYVGPTLGSRSDGAHEDAWGVWRRPKSYGDGAYDEICHYPLADAQDVGDLDKHRWPSPDWLDCEGVPASIERLNAGGEVAILTGGGNIFEKSWYMRGFERMLMDLAVNPELAREIMRRVTDYCIATLTRVLEAARGRVDVVFTADDIGGQNGLLMSLGMWEEHLKPHHVRLNRALHEFGVKVMYHSDGDVMDAVPGLIDMGIDVLQALQFSAGAMDARVLKDSYGDRLCFEGGIDVQTTLPFGTADDVRREVVERIEVLGRHGGYILGPSHAIQAGTPPENIVALFETAAAHRWR